MGGIPRRIGHRTCIEIHNANFEADISANFFNFKFRGPVKVTVVTDSSTSKTINGWNVAAVLKLNFWLPWTAIYSILNALSLTTWYMQLCFRTIFILNFEISFNLLFWNLKSYLRRKIVIEMCQVCSILIKFIFENVVYNE